MTVYVFKLDVGIVTMPEGESSKLLRIRAIPLASRGSVDPRGLREKPQELVLECFIPDFLSRRPAEAPLDEFEGHCGGKMRIQPWLLNAFPASMALSGFMPEAGWAAGRRVFAGFGMQGSGD